MNIQGLSSMVSRLFFAVSFVLLVVAVIERASNFLDYTILPGSYTAGRLLELAVVLLIFVLALLLRDVRNEIRKSDT